MPAIRKDSIDQYRVSFGELAKVRRGEPVLVDPYLIARAVAAVMRECTVRSAAGRPILWNEYRVVLARADFDLVRSLQGPLERDLATVLTQEAQQRQAELVGALRITVVFDEADELPAGQGVVRVAFVPTDKLVAPRNNEMTVRLDGWAVAGEIAARAAQHNPSASPDTVFVQDAGDTARAGETVLAWPGGEVALAVGATVVVGRPHPEAPPQFVALSGAGAKVNKQHFWIAVGKESVRIGRLATANPVHVDGVPLAASEERDLVPPVEISLSRGDLVLALRRR